MADKDAIGAFLAASEGSAAPTAAAQVGPSAAGKPPSADAIGAFLGGTKPSVSELPAPGAFPETALADSPLSLMDRARLGHARTPEHQLEALESLYGKGNAQAVNKGKEQQLVVKHDGVWRQADPAFAWSMKGLSDLPGDIAQFTGEYGLRSAAAAAAAPAGIAAGMAAGAPLGPIGMAAGGAAGGLAAAGAGAFGAEALDQGTRYVAGDKTGAHSPTELAQQLYSSMLFGMDQEAAAGALKLGGKASVAALAGTLSRITDTSAGKAVASKILGSVSGIGEKLARVRVDDPFGVARYDAVAVDDLKQGTNRLYDMMKDKVSQAYDGFMSRKKQLFGGAYDAVEDAGRKLDYSPVEANNGVLKALDDHGYTKNGRAINYRGSENVERDVRGPEAATINYVTNSVQKMGQKLSKGGSVTFDEIRHLTQTLDTRLHESDALVDENLKRVLGDYVTDLKSHLQGKLANANPDLANQFAQMNQQYGPLKGLLKQLGKVSEDNRVDAFLKSVIKDDGSFNSDLMSNISGLLKTADPTADVMKMHVARKSTDLLGKGSILKIIPTQSPYLASRATTGIAAVGREVQEAVAPLIPTIPYADKANQMLRSLSPQAKRMLKGNPDALNALASTLGGAAEMEKQGSQALLQSSGVLAPQQGQ
jgi:polyhydroxyalkanoate synthesis regulator phasin